MSGEGFTTSNPSLPLTNPEVLHLRDVLRSFRAGLKRDDAAVRLEPLPTLVAAAGDIKKIQISKKLLPQNLWISASFSKKNRHRVTTSGQCVGRPRGRPKPVLADLGGGGGPDKKKSLSYIIIIKTSQSL